MNEQTVLADTPLLLPDIIQRYSNGESVESIASDCHVTRYTIYNWMFTELGDAAYEQTVTKCLVRGIADADKDLEESRDSLAFNKAHARARLKRQDLERRRPKLYGQQQQVNTDTKLTVIIQRERPLPVVVGDNIVSDVAQVVDNTSGSSPKRGSGPKQGL